MVTRSALDVATQEFDLYLVLALQAKIQHSVQLAVEGKGALCVSLVPLVRTLGQGHAWHSARQSFLDIGGRQR